MVSIFLWLLEDLTSWAVNDNLDWGGDSRDEDEGHEHDRQAGGMGSRHSSHCYDHHHIEGETYTAEEKKK